MPQRSLQAQGRVVGSLNYSQIAELGPEREENMRKAVDKQSSDQSIWPVPHTQDLLQNTAIIFLCFLAMKISDGRRKIAYVTAHAW